MSEVKNMARAKATYEALLNNLDSHSWKYAKDEEKLSVECGARGDDLDIDLTIQVDADRMLVLVISPMPFKVKEDKRLDVCLAVNAINYMLVDGSFDYDIASGHLFFRMTTSFIDSVLGDEVFSYLIFCSCQTIDEYNDKLLMLSSGILSLEKFLELLKN